MSVRYITVMSDYSELLKDPRWQKKRLKIMERDNFTCQKCSDKETTLNVHHKYYDKDKKPWEYQNGSLVTLCKDCHLTEHEESAEYKKLLTDTLYNLGYSADDLREIAYAFTLFGKAEYKSNILTSAIAFYLSEKITQKEIINIYNKR